MTLPRWLQCLRNSLATSRPECKRPRRPSRPNIRRRPAVEQLEERTLPAAVTWTGAAGDGLWGTAGNWSTGSVPGGGDDVTIPAPFTVMHTSAADTINTLTLNTGATLQITGGSLIDVLGASGPQVTNNGTIDLGASDGSTAGGLSLTGATSSIAGTGIFNLGSNASNGLAGGNLTIGSGLSINAAGGTIGDTSATGTLTNLATITTTAAAGTTVTVYLGGASTSGTNSGTIQDTSGNLQVYGGFTNQGPISISGGGTLILGDNNLDSWTNSISGGTITTTNSTVMLDGAITQAGIGTLNRDSGSTIDLTGDLTGGLTLDSTTGSWFLLGGKLSGALTATGGSALIGTGSGGTLDAVSLDASNALDLATNLGATVTAVNGLTLSGTTLTIGNNAYGALYFQGAASTLAGTGTITLGANANNTLAPVPGTTLTVASGISINATGGTIGCTTGVLTNQGTITASSAGGTVTVVLGGSAGSGTNSGTINATNGDLTVSGAFSNSGTISISSAAGVLTLGDAMTDVWTNTGTISTTSTDTVNLAGAITQAGIGTLNFSASTTVNLTGSLTGGLSLSVSTGSWFLEGGTLAGALTASGGSVLFGTATPGILNGVSLDASNALDMQTVNGATVLVTNSLTLSGTTINLGNSAGTTSGVMEFTTLASSVLGTGTVALGANNLNILGSTGLATLTITSGINVNVSEGLVGGVNGALVNQGTITASPPVTNATAVVNLGVAGLSGTNSGTIQDTSGLGELDVTGPFTNAGTVSISSGILVVGSGNFTWTNTGTISTTNSSVHLDGSFTQAGLGSLVRGSGSIIRLTGTLTGGLSLNATTGTWLLDGGTLSGPLTATSGSVLEATDAGVLNGVSLDATSALDLHSFDGALVDVTGALTLNNTGLQIGDSAGTTAAELFFNSPTSNLLGTGDILLGPNSGNDLSTNANDSLTIAAGIRIDASGGTVGSTLGVLNNAGFIVFNNPSVPGTVNLGGSNGSGTNSGTIILNNVFGTLAVAGGFSNTGTIETGGALTLGTAGETWSNTGTVVVDTSPGTVLCQGTLTEVDGNTLTAGTWEALQGGRIRFPAGTNITTNDATLILSGAGSQISGIDNLSTNDGSLTATRGASLASSGDFTNNGTLTIGPGSTLTVSGNATQTALGTLNIQIAGTPQSPQFGQLKVTGQITAGGTVNIDASNAEVALGQVFPVATFASVTKDFLTFTGLAPLFAETLSPTSLVVTALANGADLEMGNIGAPASASPGQTITVGWTVGNFGFFDDVGNWQDSVYLSPTPTLTSRSILLGVQPHSGGLALNQSYDASLTTAIPALPLGNYYVLVQTDSLNQQPLPDRSVSIGAAPRPLDLTLPALTLGTPQAFSFAASDQDQYYQVSVPAGGTLTFALQNTAVSETAALYVSRGILPTPHNFQYAAAANQPNQTLTVPQVLTAGTYYVLVHSITGNASSVTNADYTLTATQTSALTISAISSYAGGNAGNVTIEIDGTNFAPTLAARLALGAGTPLQATAIDFVNASQLFATFNLTGAAAGGYSLSVQQANQVATAPTPFQVVAASPTALNVVLITPQFVPTGRTGTVTITYANTTNNDLVAPLLDFSSTNPHVSFSTPDNPNNYTQSAQVLAVAAQGPAGILRPGQSGTLTLTLLSADPIPGDQIPIQVTQLQPGQPNNLASEETALQPSTFTPAAWSNAIFPNLLAELGSTTDSYNAALAQTATYLAGLGETTAQVSDVSRLFSFLIAQANAALPTAALASTVDDSLAVPGKLPLAVDRTFVSSIAGRYQMGIFGMGWTTSWQTTLGVDPAGNVTINSGGTVRYFVLQPNGTYLDTAGETGTLTLAGGVYTFTNSTGIQYVFLPNGSLNYMQDTNSNRITLGYNTNQQPIRLLYTNAADALEPSQEIDLTYNGQNVVSQVSDSVGNIWTYQYDAAGHLLSVTAPGNLTTSYTYDTGTNLETANALLSITHTDGSVQNFTYDAQGRLSVVSQTGGADPIAYTYAGQGQVTATDAAGDQSIVFYNDLGLPARVQDPRGNIATYAYDGDGNLVGYTDAAGNQFQYSYDGNGNLTQITNPLGQGVELTYGPESNLTSLTDPGGNTTLYQADPAGNLRSITYPGGERQGFQYDPLGNQIATILGNGDAVTYQYNAEGQVTQKTFRDGSSQTFGYDARGNLLTAKTFDSGGALTGTTTLTYNAANQLTSIAYPSGQSLTFTYNAQGQRSRSVDQSGFTINYGYDTLGRLATLRDGSDNVIVAYHYNAVGQLDMKTNGNGTYTTYVYDTAGNLTSETNYTPGATVNSSFTYTYNALNQVTSVTDNAGHTTTYGYDALGQLTQVTLPSGQTIAYSYNAAGDRTQVVANSTTTTYTSNADNEITQVGSASYSYDPNGNLQSVSDATGTTTYGYNDLNQLVSLTAPNGSTTSFQYSPLGFLVGSNVGGTQTNYLVDPTGATSIVAAYNGASLTADFVYGLGLESQTGPGGTGYYDFDRSGNTVGITGTNGSYVNQYSYLPFGETTPVSATLPNPFTFAGQAGVLQINAGLFSFRARDYLVVTGQFLSNDPTGLGGSDPNLRRYVGNDPVTLLDITGFISQANAALQAYAAAVAQLYQQYANAVNTPVSPLPSQSYYTGPLFIVASTGSRAATPADRRAHTSGTAGGGNAPAGAGTQLPTGLSATQAAHGVSAIPSAAAPISLVGPTGTGKRNFIQPLGNWSYNAEFQNTGTSPVKKVTLTEQVDANLDWTQFQLGSFGFGPVAVMVPAGLTDYQTTLVYTNSDGTPLTVSVALHFNVQTGLLTATFTSLDPNTGQSPAGVRDGFLPPDDSHGIGRAFVQYTVPPQATLPTFATIHQQAAVTFDGNAPQNTNLVTHTIDAGFPATHLVIPPLVQALRGGKTTITVDAVGTNGQIDALYSGSVVLLVTGAPAGGSLSGALVAPVQDGVATFSGRSFSALGSYTLTAGSTTDLQPGTATVQVVAAPVFHVTLAPVTVRQTGAGAQFTATVSASDPGYLGTVQLSSSDPHAVLPGGGTYTFQPTDHGTKAFTVTLLTPGARTITATDVSLPTVRATSNAETVTPLSVSKFVLTASASQPPVIDVPYAITVTAEDQYGNKITNFNGTVQYTGAATLLSRSLTFNNGTLGLLIKPTAVGSVTVSLTDGSSHTGTLTKTVLSAATHLTLQVTPKQTARTPGETAGMPFTLTVVALTAAGQPDPNFSDNLHFASAGGSPVDQPFISNTSGSQNAVFTLTKAGTQTITVTDPSRPQVKGATLSVSVTALAASRLILSAKVVPALDGVADTVTLTAEDKFGNPAANYQGTVTLTASGATLSKNTLTPRPAATFTLTPTSLGNLTINATDGTITGSLPLSVVSAATHLALGPLPTSIQAEKLFQITLSALTAANKPAPFQDTLHFADNLGNTGLPPDGPYTGQPYSLTLPNAGRQTITITDVTIGRVVGVLTTTVKPAKDGITPTAGVSGPTVGVPGQPLTFTLSASASDAPTNAVYTYHIDWVGNGTVTQTVSGPNGMTVTHTYPVTSATHFTVTVTAVDPAGNASTPAGTGTHAVSITTTAVENDPATNTLTALAVGCPLGGATVVVNSVAGVPNLTVTINNTMQALPGQTFSHVFVFGQTGTDNVTVSGTVPAVLIGGTGTNVFSAQGSGATTPDVLVGGTGHSTLTGGSGRDILIGGGGPASLVAGGGDDILIGGSTVYDANVAALLALVQEWGRMDIGYAQRIQDLFGTGVGQNGSDVLTAQTITQDVARNQLVGGSGTDWFWLSESGKTLDRLGNYTGGEVVSFRGA